MSRIENKFVSFRELFIKNEYRSSQDNVVNDFYNVVLNRTIFYKRAVGFFSSTAFIELAQGLKKISEKNGKIQLIVSPKLSNEDIDAIKSGYQNREQLIGKIILRDFDMPTTIIERKRLSFLTHLIEHNILDIKVAFLRNSNGGMYHEKIGILKDGEENIIAFSGSMNETVTAFSYNYESIDVYCSWKNSDSNERAILKEKAFDRLWENLDKGVETIDFPKVLLSKFKEIKYLFNEDEYILGSLEAKEDSPIYYENFPTVPENFNPRDYQIEAVENWVQKEYKGIFDMATGSGKTFTALLAIVRLFKDKKRTFVVIVCPYQHLVEQWSEELEYFNIKPLIGYSDYKDYRNRLEELVSDYILEVINFGCFICTNASFSTPKTNEIIKTISEQSLIIIDEAHNFGSTKLYRSLHNDFKYRLALSATLERHNDVIGTKYLYKYFGEKCIEYSLKKAIEEGQLTPYVYFPILVNLNEFELSKYYEYTREAMKNLTTDEYGNTVFNTIGKKYLLKRSKVVASAEMKVSSLITELKKYTTNNGILIYCGATNMIDEDFDDDLRQIDLVSRQIYEKLGIRSSQFTANESAKEREQIKNDFVSENIQAITAIRCLDEGVNIPSIRTAFILASTTNPKEYIQRRGRVLRLAKNKKISEIYDFICLPRALNDAQYLTFEEMKFDKSLLLKEINRINEFKSLANNSSESDKLINKIKDAYKTLFDKNDFDEEIAHLNSVEEN